MKKLFAVVIGILILSGCASVAKWNNDIIARQQCSRNAHSVYEHQANLVGWTREKLIGYVGQPDYQGKSYSDGAAIETLIYETWNSSGGISRFKIILTNDVVTDVTY